jgi:hypothetical protein
VENGEHDEVRSASFLTTGTAKFTVDMEFGMWNSLEFNMKFGEMPTALASASLQQKEEGDNNFRLP